MLVRLLWLCCCGVCYRVCGYDVVFRFVVGVVVCICCVVYDVDVLDCVVVLRLMWVFILCWYVCPLFDCIVLYVFMLFYAHDVHFISVPLLLCAGVLQVCCV